MQKLLDSQKSDFILYLLKEPAANTYILGNFYKYGCESENVDFFIDFSIDNIVEFVLMRYFDDYVFFTDRYLSEDKISQIIKKISSHSYRVISGNEFSIKQLSNVFKNLSLRETSLMTLKSLKKEETGLYKIRKLLESDIFKAKRLILSIDEFRDKFSNNAIERITRMIINDETYGCFIDNKLVAVVSATAVSPYSCMFTDICVDKQYRGRGISRAIIYYAAQLKLKSGVESVTLYADNPSAINIYLKTGFQYAGKYFTLHK